MSQEPLRPGEGKFPTDQIRTPVPPRRFRTSQDGIRRYAFETSALESYRTNIIRIWPDGLEQPAIDLVPDPDARTSTPTDLFGDEVTRAHIVSGVKSFGRLTTRQEDAESLLRLRWYLDHEGRVWRPTVATSPDRQWVEGGGMVLDNDPDAVSYLAQRHGQSITLQWDADGIRPVPATGGTDVGDPTPVPVRLTPARTGCPLRCGADGVCKMYGGPWTSSSISAALIWKSHRAMLLDAFGCGVCMAEGGDGPIGAVDLFSPSREGGWQWGLPKTLGMLNDER